ncbi:efflux RND transporter periplasmic adaptor subunit [Paenibacillus sp. TAB 01]|uniref:efflux RND transporter periplasmic adaptor subunit n=1 Tax=Paenibacillus sp. TAB 01 TaxID=3368988 RepID=UPI003752FC1D
MNLLMARSRKKKMNQTYRTLAVLTLAAMVASGCSMGGPKNVQADIQIRPVKTEAVAKQNIGSPTEQVGEVTAVNVIDVVPKVNGEVVDVLKNRGDFVEKGEVLFRVDSKDAESARQKNELSLKSSQDSYQKAKDDQVNNRKDLADAVEKAKIALTNAQNDYNKTRNDFDAGTSNQHQVDLAKQQVDTAQMALESAQNKLAVNDSNNSIIAAENQMKSASLALEDSIRALDNYSVKAPASGILTDFTLVPGQTVSASKVGQVQQIDPVKIKTELSEANYQLVKNKQELVFYNPDTPDKKGTGKISYMAPIMSAQTKTYTVELDVPNPEHTIEPGSRVMIQLTTENEQSVVAIPTLSIIREDSSTYVFVQQGDQYQKRAVKLGRINGQYQEVLDGLKEGDQLVVTGQNQLKDGQKVDNGQAAAPTKTTNTQTK